jgi:hypothetical protein
VRSRLVPLHSRLGPSLGPLPRPWLRILRQPSGSLAMPWSEDRWRPACRPLATARSRRVTFHPYKGEEPSRTVVSDSEEKTESRGQPRSEAYARLPYRRLTDPHGPMRGAASARLRTLYAANE